MKTVTGGIINAEPISLSKAATILSGFVSSENEATQDVSAYLRRASAAFIELKSIHREIRSTKPKSVARQERNPTGEFEELVRAKRIDDMVENSWKISSRGSESVTEEESSHGRKQDEIKEHKKKKKSKEDKEKEVVEEKLENEQRNVEKKESKKNKKEDVIEEKVNVKLEQERKEGKKKKKSTKNREEDVIDEKVNVKLEQEQRSEETMERKKKRNSDGEICSEERKSKKKRKLKVFCIKEGLPSASRDDPHIF